MQHMQPLSILLEPNLSPFLPLPCQNCSIFHGVAFLMRKLLELEDKAAVPKTRGREAKWMPFKKFIIQKNILNSFKDS